MAGIKLTPTRRSQLLEQLLKQNEQQWAQNPQTGLELGLKLLAQGIRQGGINKLQEQQQSQQQALVDALNQPTTMQLESIDGTPMPQLSRTQGQADTAALNQIRQLPPEYQAIGQQILGGRKDLRDPSVFEQKQMLQKDAQKFEAEQAEYTRSWKYGIHEDELAEAQKDRGLRRELVEKNDKLQRDLAAQSLEFKREVEKAKAQAGGDIPDATWKVAGYGVRAENADTILTQSGDEFTGFINRATQHAPRGLKTEERQRFEQAERNFINATLRRESGAVISDAEFDNAREQYIPQPGDDEATLKQKALNRKEVIEGYKAQGQGAYEQIRSRVEFPDPLYPDESNGAKILSVTPIEGP